MMISHKLPLAAVALASSFARASAFSQAIVSRQYHLRPAFASGASRSFLSMAAPGVEVASQGEILEALEHENVTLLDARGLDEIMTSGYVQLPGKKWVHAQCTPTDAPLLSIAAENLIPDKSAPVICYCAAGKRAAKAKEVLESKGYENVLNAGAITDLDFLKR